MESEVRIRKKIEEVLEVENVKDILLDEDLREYGMDSLNAIELVVELEMELGMEFSEDDLLLDNLCTIEKLMDIIQKHIES